MFYLYLRRNDWFDTLNIIKVGIFGEKQKNNRHSTYKTSEPIQGYFTYIWEINESEMNVFDEWLKTKLNDILYINTGGTEFYTNIDNNIHNYIEFILNDYKINYRKLNDEEINKISRNKVERKKNKFKDQINIFENRKDNNLEKINLYEFQKEVNIVDFLKKNKKGILNWICRLGKTIKSIDTLIALQSKKICIGVPSIQLLNQWEIKLKKYCNHTIIKLGDTNNPDIKKEYNQNEQLIILTVYNSAYKIKETNLSFDLKILDEAHHLTYTEDKSYKAFKVILDIESKYQLSLTATLKIGNDKIIGNDNNSIFGNIIDSKSLKWAIDNGYVCDYDICTPIVNKDEYLEHFEDLYIMDNDELFTGKETEKEKKMILIDLLISCIQQLEVLKLNKHSHCINYSNKINHAKICKNIIDKLLMLDKYNDLNNNFVNEYVSDITTKTQEQILDNYKKSKKGIIHSCFKLGEGFDEEIVDMVCISENMISDIRILQSLLRPHTKSKSNLDKKALILLPIIVDDDYKPTQKGKEKDKFKKVIDIIDIISNSDENVHQKASFIKVVKKPPPKSKTNYYNIDEIFNTSIKIKFMHKNMIKGCSYTNLKKLIKLMKFRNNDVYSLREDYINKQRLNKRLPQLETVESILKRTNKSWFNLYNIDISKYSNYNDFNSKYGSLYDKNKYIKLSREDDKVPPYSDLEDLYRNYGYNINFWYNPVGDIDEF